MNIADKLRKAKLELEERERLEQERLQTKKKNTLPGIKAKKKISEEIKPHFQKKGKYEINPFKMSIDTLRGLKKIAIGGKGDKTSNMRMLELEVKDMFSNVNVFGNFLSNLSEWMKEV
ncbi:hypothetical protein DSAG12_04405 [Promethearchaeum syntrophicum]|uniref:Uncharacterized protein n=1 Tax=Promethearchaeum syntrophicum TaxID=2594042 RepID=A0AC61ZU23_9ARCH